MRSRREDPCLILRGWSFLNKVGDSKFKGACSVLELILSDQTDSFKRGVGIGIIFPESEGGFMCSSEQTIVVPKIYCSVYIEINWIWALGESFISRQMLELLIES